MIRRARTVDRHYRDVMEKALRNGHAALRPDKGTGLDAVEATIRVLSRKSTRGAS